MLKSGDKVRIIHKTDGGPGCPEHEIGTIHIIGTLGGDGYFTIKTPPGVDSRNHWSYKPEHLQKVTKSVILIRRK